MLAGLLALLWYQRLEVATWFLDRMVISGDIDNLRISPARIDLDGSSIDSIAFTSRTGDAQYQVNASGIEVDYRLTDLRSVTVSAITMEKLSVEQSALTAAEADRHSDATGVAQILSDLKRILTLSLPLQSLTIAQLKLSLPQQNLWIDNGSVAIQAEANGATGRIEDGSRHIDLTLESGYLLARLGTTPPTDGEILTIEMVPPEADEELRLTSQLNTTALAQWLANYPATSAVTALLESVHTLARLELGLRPDDQGYLAAIALSSDQLTAEGWQVSGLSAVSRLYLTDQWLNQPVSRIEFDAATQLKAAKIQTGDLKISGIKLQPQGFIAQQDGILQAALNPGSKISAALLEIDDFVVNGLEMQPAMTITDQKIKILRGLKARAGQVSGPGFVLTKPGISADKASTLVIDADGGFNHSDGQWRVNTGIDLGDGRQISGDFAVAIQQMDGANLTASVVSDAPAVNLDTPIPAIQTLSADIVRKDAEVDARGTLKIYETDSPFDFSLKQNIDSMVGQGRLLSTAPLDARAVAAIASTLEFELPDTLSIENGTLDITLDANWDKDQLGLTSAINVNQLSVLYLDSQFKQINLEGKLDLLPVLRSDGNLVATIAALEYGVAVENLAAVFSVEPSPHGELPLLLFSNVEGNLLGSRFFANDFPLDINKPDTSLNVNIQNLDIEQVVATQNVDGLEATGQIDGTLPVTISKDGVSIKDGAFWNHLEGGNIVYLISDEQAAALDNPLTDLVIKALRDFRYRVLNVDADYRPNGDLMMNFHFEGVSPLIDPNRPVHLNINSEQNVLSLLKSLSYSEGVNKTLDKQIQEQFE